MVHASVLRGKTICFIVTQWLPLAAIGRRRCLDYTNLHCANTNVQGMSAHDTMDPTIPAAAPTVRMSPLSPTLFGQVGTAMVLPVLGLLFDSLAFFTAWNFRFLVNYC